MQQRTILWADDDSDDLMLMRQALDNQDDFLIVEVNNGREALDYLDGLKKDSLPCLIILDMNMPVLNGRETLALLKTDPRYKDIATVVFTTSNSELDKIFCKRYSVEMVTKPPNFAKFKEVVSKILALCPEK